VSLPRFIRQAPKTVKKLLRPPIHRILPHPEHPCGSTKKRRNCQAFSVSESPSVVPLFCWFATLLVMIMAGSFSPFDVLGVKLKIFHQRPK
jgi:hypothetical protein